MSSNGAGPVTLNIPRGGYVFREGEAARFAYILESGEVEIVGHTAEGETLLGEVKKGEIFGEMAIIDGSARSASARARSDATVIEVDKELFLKHISSNPQTALNLMNRLSGYVRAANRRASGSALEAAPAAVGSADSGATTPLAEAVDDTDALYDAPAARTLLIAGVLVMGFLAAAIAWMSLSFVDTTVSARGKFTTRVPNVVVQATGNSVIQELLVERGQEVRAGDVIARLDGTFVNANLSIVEGKIAAVDQRIARIGLEQEFLSGEALAWDGRLDTINEEILLKRLDEYTSRLGAFGAQIARLDREAETGRADLELARQQIDVKRQIEDARRTLYDKQVGSLLNLLSARDGRLTSERERFSIENRIANLESQRQAVLAEREAFIADRSAQLAEELSQYLDERRQLTEEQRKLQRQHADLNVRSPVSGIVLDLPTVSAGSIVREGEPIVTLVRSGVALALEVDIDPKDVSDLRLGAPVSVKLDALPFQQFGDLNGELLFVSDDTFEQSLQGKQGAFYRGRVQLAPDALDGLPPGFRLTPGMLATADMKVGQRRLVTYFTNPILRTLGTAMREPE